ARCCSGSPAPRPPPPPRRTAPWGHRWSSCRPPARTGPSRTRRRSGVSSPAVLPQTDHGPRARPLPARALAAHLGIGTGEVGAEHVLGDVAIGLGQLLVALHERL